MLVGTQCLAISYKELVLHVLEVGQYRFSKYCYFKMLCVISGNQNKDNYTENNQKRKI